MKPFLFVLFIIILTSCSRFNKEQELAKGFRLFKADSLQQAVNVLTKVISNVDTCYQGYLYRGWAYKGLKEYGKALNDFSILVNLDKSNPTGLANRASVYYLKFDYSNALKDFQEAYQFDTTATFFYNPICHMLFATGQKDEACRYYQKALEINDTTFDEPIVEYCRKKNYR